MAVTLALPPALDGQVREVADRCVSQGTAPTRALCEQFATAALLAQGGTGLAQAGGNAFTGAASTVGRRFGATPRVALSVRGGLTRFPVLSSDGGTTADERRAVAPSLHGQVTVGVFDGFSPAPTVGGLLSVDLLLTGGIVFLPGGKGFDGSVSSWGYGARLGILRESFTLPGVTFSVAQHRGGGSAYTGGWVTAALDGTTTTSLRLTVGKELMIGGLLAGAGWDRYVSDGELRSNAPFMGPLPIPPTELDGFESSRLLFYGGWSRTFLVAQVAVEGGWARGFARDTDAFTSFDPGTGSLFGTVSFRVTF